MAQGRTMYFPDSRIAEVDEENIKKQITKVKSRPQTYSLDLNADFDKAVVGKIGKNNRKLEDSYEAYHNAAVLRSISTTDQNSASSVCQGRSNSGSLEEL